MIRALAGLLLAAPLVAPAAARADEARVESILRRLTVEQKLGQLQQLNGDVRTGGLLPGQDDLLRRGLVGSFLNVRGVGNVNAAQKIAVEESPAKIPLLLAFDVIHGYRTVFPVPLGEASSWDPAAAERSARVAAVEASSAGLDWTFAPMVDVARDPRWGRVVEGSGEDPYLGSKFAAARVRGFQGDDYAAPGRLMACVKHWAAYGATEGGRDYNTVDVSERSLRTLFFPPFKAGIDAGSATLMTALNAIDGVPATANPFLMKSVLRGEWGYDGLVVSDYEAVAQLIPHGVAADGAQAAALALDATTDVEMVSKLYVEHGAALLRGGSIAMARLDESVRRVLRAKDRLGLFDRPYITDDREAATLLSADHRRAAREVAARSMVLLKNDGKLLPIRPSTRRIAVVGPFADDQATPMGPWSGDGRASDVVGLLAGLRARFEGRPDAPSITHSRGCGPVAAPDDSRTIAEAARVADEADLAIVAVGEEADRSGEATSIARLDLPGNQVELLKAIRATGTPVVAVLMNGRPLALGPVVEAAPAILETWYAGSMAGPAIADVLFGDANPGGKLPISFPRSVGQVPTYYNHLNTGRPLNPTDKYTSKYVDEPNGPLFPFGFGMSYTEFRLSNLRIGAPSIAPDGRVEVSADVANVGDRAGDEVVQLYIRDEVASVARPVRELKGFERLTIAPGETRTARFTLGPAELGLYDGSMRFVVEPGAFRVFVGTGGPGGLEGLFSVSAPAPGASQKK